MVSPKNVWRCSWLNLFFTYFMLLHVVPLWLLFSYYCHFFILLYFKHNINIPRAGCDSSKNIAVNFQVVIEVFYLGRNATPPHCSDNIIKDLFHYSSNTWILRKYSQLIKFHFHYLTFSAPRWFFFPLWLERNHECSTRVFYEIHDNSESLNHLPCKNWIYTYCGDDLRRWDYELLLRKRK